MAGTIINPVIVKIATADTEEDLLSNSGETIDCSFSMHLSNDGSTAATAEVWITNGSNTHQFPLLPETTISAKKGISNVTKITLAAGSKIRVTASSTDVYAMICPASGV